MASNGKSGDNRRIGAVKHRSQVFNPQIKRFVERNMTTGLFINIKSDGKKFKGVRIEK